MKKTLVLAISAALFSTSCAMTDSTTATAAVIVPAAKLSTAVQVNKPSLSQTAAQTFTLEQIMADPDWMGRSPERPFWSVDGSSVLFQQKQAGSPVRTLQRVSLAAEQPLVNEVALSALHQEATDSRVYSADRSQAAYVFERNIFVINTANGQIQQLTQDHQNRSSLQFLTDGRLSFRQGNDFFAIDPSSGRTQLLVSLATSDAPEPVQAPADYLAKEEVELMLYNQVQRQQRQQNHDYRTAVQTNNAATAPAPFYLGKNKQIAEASLAPTGDKLIVAITEPQSWRADGDHMPRFVTESGRVELQNVRRRVADAKPVHQELFLLDLNTGTKHQLGYHTLPGFDEDVLKSVREENYAARGEKYESKKAARAIGVMPNWSAGQGNIVWQTNGEGAATGVATGVAIMLRAWDNKDRWIATVDFNNHTLVNQHRLHDDAWINRHFNDMGWLPNSNKLWYSSEESGYGHIYIRDLANKGRTQQITAGNYLVDEVVLDQTAENFYFRANKTHPGVYEIYRVSVNGGDVVQLTNLGGMTSYSLSPDESTLLLSHSNALQPTELYVQANQVGAQAQRITHTISEQFSAMPWTAPDIVAVPSSHGEHPIYSRVYLPEGYDANAADKYPAVVFIHGAGYLQNAHAGFSGYFREFMFHNLLLEQGYVVLDLDFRGSAGYGRDWRTAVYRQMGTPEVEDLVDVVQWMGENTNVDTDRVGTYGGSYGGFLTFMALFKEPGLFKAGAALRPVSDWAHYNTGYTANILNLPQDDPIAYRRSSPIYFADGLQDALLINAPMVDDNVFFQDTVRIVQRFIELEKDNFETAIFPVEPHGFVQPSSWLNEYRKMFKLFEDNLK
ncbi:prolyl oligopeptidase family serine peptidase [Aliidiomarina quisquiliarum]|uniref:S9 family peptidase n=1 Tax=Aliidiomarina quisquiliarum TaxID=2938947 RepID=UPI00208EB2F1|nr:prolyl oligopeptidase family serine peptidase [Aliidiomarina quisquiliarum]MCO4320622.1 prolyl oligopeptidase family serine peptidase [Aliidiomarina quisquiliarum]